MAARRHRSGSPVMPPSLTPMWCRCFSKVIREQKNYRRHISGRLLGISFMTLAEPDF
jgi:hypothetical protein